MLEFFRSSAVRVALAFVLATTVATTAVFGLVYLQIGEANEARNRLILEDEAAKGVNYSVDELKYAFDVRMTHDLRRVDYAALFGADRKVLFGNIDQLPAIPVDGKSHYIAAPPLRGGDNRLEPAIFVARAAAGRHHHITGPKPARDPCLSPDRTARPGRCGRADAAAGAGDRLVLRAARVAASDSHSRYDRPNHEG